MPAYNASISRALAVAFAISLACPHPNASANEAAEKARLASKMWAAFQCSTLAELSGNKEQQEALFDVGLQAGRRFIEAIKANKITNEAINAEVPLVVTMMLQGPSVDFMIGRIFESALGDAYDEIVKRQNGKQLDVSQWMRDDEMRKMKASTQFRTKNCHLIH